MSATAETAGASEAGAVAAAAAALSHARPEAILAYAFEHYRRVALSTAFGPEGCALIHMACAIAPPVAVFTVDTGYLFPESLALQRRFAERYPITLSVFESQLSLVEQERLHGPRLYERDPDLCCALRKVEPTARALRGIDAWIAGLRRDQGQSRAGLAVLERYAHDDGTPLVKVNPLAAWSRADTFRYLLEHDVPYNPLLDEGYPSIGCQPCTAPVSAEGAERAGRWGGRKQECGIHTFLDRKE